MTYLLIAMLAAALAFVLYTLKRRRDEHRRIARRRAGRIAVQTFVDKG